jgi:WD40 repeat protein
MYPVYTCIHTYRFLVAGSDDNTVRVWDLPTGRQATVMEGHSKAVHVVEWSPDGEYIISGGADECVCVWRAGVQVPGRFVNVNFYLHASINIHYCMIWLFSLIIPGIICFCSSHTRRYFLFATNLYDTSNTTCIWGCNKVAHSCSQARTNMHECRTCKTACAADNSGHRNTHTHTHTNICTYRT